MSGQILALCKQLYQAALTSKEQCEKLVPTAFNAALLEALQHVMLHAVQLQEDEQLHAVRSCLEAALQLLSRVSSLGPIEAFFSADELLAHYQWRVDATRALLHKIWSEPTPCCSAAAQHSAAAPAGATGSAKQQLQAAADSRQMCSKCQLQLPAQQQQIVQKFRRQATKVCPLLVQSCQQAGLQQLCDTVKQGLVLVNGHSFLIGQDWQAEVTAMLVRAEQLKVLLAHWQAHHLSLLASVLQHLHQQEVRDYDMPRPRSSSPNKRTHAASSSQGGNLPLAGAERQQQQRQSAAGTLAAGLQLLQQEQQEQTHAALQTEFHSVCLEDDAGDSDDEFFLPVAPVGRSPSGSPNGSPASAAAAGLPSLPFHLPAGAHGCSSSSIPSDGDSLARTLSSGCSSLLEYVNMQNACIGSARASMHEPAGSSGTGMLQVSIEQQLLSIAGSAEVAAVLASALGFEQVPCSRSSSMCGGINSVGGASVSMAGALAAAAGGSGSFTLVSCRDSSCQSGKSSPGHSRPGSAIARLSSTASKVFAEGLAGDRSSPGTQHQHQQRRRWRRPQKPSSTLLLQQMQLPPGCCRSIGAVCYLCPHLKRVVLVGVGLTDQEVGDLVDALKVNSSVQHLELSHNDISDIGARVLAKLLRPSAGCSSRLRTLCLQHNQICDDGAAALAAGLSSSSLRRLWLHHNAVGEAGAKALCRAMRTNTCCTDVKLLPGNDSIPAQLAQTVQQLARQNRGARDHIKSLLRMVHWPSN